MIEIVFIGFDGTEFEAFILFDESDGHECYQNIEFEFNSNV